jgi:hypothetical protein
MFCHPTNKRRGQVVVFLLMLLTALAFVFLWNVDLNRLITVKNRTQNAGDAAALAAARWQGISMNLVGELNLLHALALSANNASAIDSITNVQARVLLSGPMTGFATAQVAAKNNGIYVNNDFTQLIINHAEVVRHDYTMIIDGHMLFDPPYLGAWDDYADMLDAIAGNGGIAAGPDNAIFYGANVGSHILLDKNFYNAVAGYEWCWFFDADPYYTYPSPLSDYTDFHFWPPLPTTTATAEFNSEFLSLWLLPRVTPLANIITSSNLLGEAANENFPMTGFTTNAMNATMETWYVYDPSHWGPWTAISTTSTNPFPVTGPIKSQYDYAGADVAMLVYGIADRMTPGYAGTTITNNITWVAAAKTFGSLGPSSDPIPPMSYGLVLPSFTDVRLIPLDTCSGANADTFDTQWYQHVSQHLPQYMTFGPSAVAGNGCWYCQQLVAWENPVFRQNGLLWLSTNSWRCTIGHGGGGGGGGGNGGGSRFGH